MLYGCIHVPDFAVQAALRLESANSLKSSPVAILDGPDSLPKVIACNRTASNAGTAPGMTKVQAAALPNVVFLKRDPALEQAAHSALLDCGSSFSPRLESTCPGTVIIDLTGTERLMGSPTEVGRQLADVATKCGLDVRVALAANPDTAQVAARGFDGVTVIARGEEQARLSCLPIEVLQPEPEILETLDSWGIRDLRSLSGLPELALSQRLGQNGLRLQRLARGDIQRDLVPAEPPWRFQESIELEEPIELLEPLAFILNRLLEQLVTRLAIRSLATDHLQLEFELEVRSDRQLKREQCSALIGSSHCRTLKLPVPTQDPKILLKLLQLDLDAHPPQHPVKKVTIEAFPARIRSEQAGLFQPRAPDPVKLEITLSRLRATVGERDCLGRALVGFPMVLDSHQPDSFEVLSTSPIRKMSTKQTGANKPNLALRIFRPPLDSTVEIRADVPTAVLFQGTRKKVLTASGPWRRSGEWWNVAGQWERDEWEMELSCRDGIALYRIFRDCHSGQWFVEGRYD